MAQTQQKSVFLSHRGSELQVGIGVWGCFQLLVVFQEPRPGLSLPSSESSSKVTRTLLMVCCGEHNRKTQHRECVGGRDEGGNTVCVPRRIVLDSGLTMRIVLLFCNLFFPLPHNIVHCGCFSCQ